MAVDRGAKRIECTGRGMEWGAGSMALWATTLKPNLPLWFIEAAQSSSTIISVTLNIAAQRPSYPATYKHRETTLDRRLEAILR